MRSVTHVLHKSNGSSFFVFFNTFYFTLDAMYCFGPLLLLVISVVVCCCFCMYLWLKYN